MMDSKIDGLMVVEALSRSSSIDTGVPTHEVAAAVTGWHGRRSQECV